MFRKRQQDKYALLRAHSQEGLEVDTATEVLSGKRSKIKSIVQAKAQTKRKQIKYGLLGEEPQLGQEIDTAQAALSDDSADEEPCVSTAEELSAISSSEKNKTKRQFVKLVKVLFVGKKSTLGQAAASSLLRSPSVEALLTGGIVEKKIDQEMDPREEDAATVQMVLKKS